jgi:hypothetical protein
MAPVNIEGPSVTTVSPEGETYALDLATLVEKVAPPTYDTGDLAWFDGLKGVRSCGRALVMIHQTPPKVHSLRWIDNGSRSRYGPKTTYRDVSIALPYLVILAVFVADNNGFRLFGTNEAFFRNEPLSDFSKDQLAFPALLNCSKFTPPEGKPLSWICTQHLDLDGLAREPREDLRMRNGFRTLRECLLHTGFNYSSEEHEGASWYGESRAREVSEHIKTVEAWEKQTRKDPLFVLDVPWIESGLTVNQIVGRIFDNLKTPRNRVAHSRDIARIVLNYGKKQ